MFQDIESIIKECNFLRYMDNTVESYVMFNGVLFIPSDESEDCKLDLVGVNTNFQRSLRISEIEAMLLNKHASKLNHIQHQSSNHLSNVQQFCDQILSAYNHKQTSDMHNKNGTIVKDITNAQIAQHLFSNKKLAVLYNRIYNFNYVDVSISTSSLRYQGDVYDLSTIESLDALFFDYEQRLIEAYKKTARGLSQNTNEVCTNYDGLLAYTSGCDNCEFMVRVPSFIVGVDGLYYTFEQAMIGVNLHFSGNTVKVESAPHLLHEYNHPFVFNSKRICFHKLNWEKVHAITFDHSYAINEAGLPSRIAEVIKRGVFALEKGYLSEDVSPVRAIEDCTDCILHSKEEALLYAQKNSIPKQRVIYNR